MLTNTIHDHSDQICNKSVLCILDKPVVENVNKYLEETTAKWQPMKVEIGSVQTMLEKTIDYWKRYHACVDIFTVWLTDAERVLDKPPEERGVSYHKKICHILFIFM